MHARADRAIFLKQLGEKGRMEFTREIYWNVGHGVLTLAPMYGLLLVALGVFVLGCLKRIKVYRLGQPVDRTDRRGERIQPWYWSPVKSNTPTRSPKSKVAIVCCDPTISSSSGAR